MESNALSVLMVSRRKREREKGLFLTGKTVIAQIYHYGNIILEFVVQEAGIGHLNLWLGFKFCYKMLQISNC